MLHFVHNHIWSKDYGATNGGIYSRYVISKFVITQFSIYFPSDEIQINCRVYHVIKDHRGRYVQKIPK